MAQQSTSTERNTQLIIENFALPPGQRLQHRRAAKACTACRNRKVRCDVLLRYPRPCTNCEFDGIDCAVPANSRRRRRTKSQTEATGKANEEAPMDFVTPAQHSGARASSTRNIPAQTQVDILNSTIAQAPSQQGANESPLYLNSAANLGDGGVAADFPDLQHIDLVLGGDYLLPDENFFDQYVLLDDQTSHSYGERQGSSSVGQASTDSPTTASPVGSLIFSPECCTFASPFPWVRSWSPELLTNQERVKIVRSKALSLPTEETITKMLRLYFIYFHPSWPILGERCFHSMLAESTGKKPDGNPNSISLALLHGVLFIASAFVSEEEARAEGFSSIRKMRTAFFSRSKALYEAGCETDDLSQIQICLLLSFQRSYLNSFYDNERWILSAWQRFKQANAIRMMEGTISSRPDFTSWKRVYCCWLMRALGLVIGLKTTSEPEILSAPIPEISVSDLDDDLTTSSFLDSAVKQHIAQLFIARVRLSNCIVSLCKMIMDQSKESLHGGPESAHRSVLGEVEDSEIQLSTWKLEHATLLSTDSKADQPVVLFHQGLLRLTYEYSISTLHQTSLSLTSDRAPMSRWAAMMREPSRRALWESVSATMETLRILDANDLTRYLPVTAIVFLLIPLTICHLYVKNSVRYNPSSLSDLSMCAKAFQVLTERYEIGDFFMELIDASLSVAHERMFKDGASEPQNTKNEGARRETGWIREASDAYLPPVNLHSMVIRFQDMSLARGSISAG